MKGKQLVSLALIFSCVISFYGFSGNVAAQTSTCTDVHGPYALEGNDGGLYGIVGIPFTFQMSNHTSATISGTLIPSTPDEIRILPAFRGDIYVTQWVIGGGTYNFGRTYTLRNGTETIVTTQTSQIVSPTTISRTAHTYSITIAGTSTTSTRVVVVGQQTTVVIAAVTVTGYLDYLSNFCITPRQSTTAGSSVITSQQSITQLNPLLIWALLIVVIVVVAIVLIVALLKRRPRSTPPQLTYPTSSLPGDSGVTMFCPSCGASVKSTANFCELCGKTLRSPSGVL
ncbi:MAG: zinc ribbon domain-containing protein [Candidatus Bathyarchaeia archaeon]